MNSNIFSVYTILDCYNSIILIVIMLSILLAINKKKNRVNQAFLGVCASTLVLVLTDLFFIILSNGDSNLEKQLLKLDTFCYYSILPLLFSAFLYYIRVYVHSKSAKKGTRNKLFWGYNIGILVIYMIFMIATPFFGSYYIFDENNIYQRGNLHIFSVILNSGYFIFGIYYTLRHKKDLSCLERFTFFLFFFVLAISELIQLINPECSIISTGLTIPVICIFINMHKNLEYELLDTEKYAEHQQTKLISLQNQTMLSLSNLVENRGRDKGNHVIRIASYVRAIATKAYENQVYPDTITPEYIEKLVKAVPLHDIGKIVVPDDILNKQGKLTEQEFNLMKMHVTEGEKIVSMVLGYEEDPRQVKMAQNIARSHHEKWDGTGYPDGKKFREIPLSARIMSIVDVFDALVSNRIYKSGTLSLDNAFDLIHEMSGISFDPKLVEQFLLIKPQIKKIIETDGVSQ